MNELDDANKKFQDFLSPSMNSFLEIEYRKRNFEYFDQKEAKWLKNHWKEGLKDIFEDDVSAGIYLNLVITTSLGKLVNLKSSSKKDEYLKIYDFIIRKRKDWLRRILNVSFKYGISAPYLMRPLDMNMIISRIKEDKLSPIIRGFVLHEYDEDCRTNLIKCIVNGVNMAPWVEFTTNKGRLDIKIDYLHSNYNFDITKSFINMVICLESLQINMNKTFESKQKEFSNMYNSIFTHKPDDKYVLKFFGLLLWDAKISGKWDRKYEVISREDLFDLFKVDKNNLTSKETDYFRNAFNSIKEMKITPITKNKGVVTDQIETLFERVRFSDPFFLGRHTFQPPRKGEWLDEVI